MFRTVWKFAQFWNFKFAYTNLQIKLNFKIVQPNLCNFKIVYQHMHDFKLHNQQARNFKGQALMREPSFTEKCYMWQKFSYQTDQDTRLLCIANARPQKIILEEKREDSMVCPMPGVVLSRASKDRQRRFQQERTVYLLF